MNMHVEAKQFRSLAEMHQEAKERRKRFETAARNRVVKIPLVSSAPIPEAPKRFIAHHVPLWEQMNGLHFDAHVVEWHLRRANPAQAYLKDRCAELGVSYKHIVGGRVLKHIVEPRHQLMWEVWDKFDLSTPQIGRLFGGRDHTTVLYAIKKIEARMAEELAAQAAE